MQPEASTFLYQQYKNYLFSIAYNMLGNAQEAEDLVHDVFERWLRLRREVTDEKAYLSRMIVNGAINRLEKRKLETYPGPWLPEPFIEDNAAPENSDILSYAMLVLLEQLNPIERAVVILRESFDHSYDEIAAICGIRSDNARQVLHRAKEKLRRPVRRPTDADRNKHKKLLEQFIRASLSGKPEQLQALLHQDIIMYADGGGKVSAASRPLEGALAVSRFFAGYGSRPEAADVSWSLETANGTPALFMYLHDSLISIFMIETEGDQISKLYVMRNPDKMPYGK